MTGQNCTVHMSLLIARSTFGFGRRW